MPTIMPGKGQHSQLLAIMMVIIINPIGQCFSTFENFRFLLREAHKSQTPVFYRTGLEMSKTPRVVGGGEGGEGGGI